MFHGYKTNSSWVTSVTAYNTPLNGGLRVYSMGANIHVPNVVRYVMCIHMIVYSARGVLVLA